MKRRDSLGVTLLENSVIDALAGSGLLVYVIIARFNRDGIHPSTKQIVDRAGVGRDTVLRGLADLTKKGFSRETLEASA